MNPGSFAGVGKSRTAPFNDSLGEIVYFGTGHPLEYVAPDGRVYLALGLDNDVPTSRYYPSGCPAFLNDPLGPWTEQTFSGGAITYAAAKSTPFMFHQGVWRSFWQHGSTPANSQQAEVSGTTIAVTATGTPTIPWVNSGVGTGESDGTVACIFSTHEYGTAGSINTAITRHTGTNLLTATSTPYSVAHSSTNQPSMAGMCVGGSNWIAYDRGRGYPGNVDASLYLRRTDGGVNWAASTWAALGFPFAGNTFDPSAGVFFNFDKSNSSIVCCAAASGAQNPAIYRSTNGGASYSLVQSFGEVGFAAGFVGIQNGNGIWVAQDSLGWVYRSTDTGITWKRTGRLPFAAQNTHRINANASRNITFVNGRFWILGFNAVGNVNAGLQPGLSTIFASSADGLTWTYSRAGMIVNTNSSAHFAPTATGMVAGASYVFGGTYRTFHAPAGSYFSTGNYPAATSASPRAYVRVK